MLPRPAPNGIEALQQHHRIGKGVQRVVFLNCREDAEALSVERFLEQSNLSPSPLVSRSPYPAIPSKHAKISTVWRLMRDSYSVVTTLSQDISRYHLDITFIRAPSKGGLGNLFRRTVLAHSTSSSPYHSSIYHQCCDNPV